MRRLLLFLGAMRWGTLLQMLVITVILGWWVWFDIQKGKWPVTILIVAMSWLIGWLMIPVMLARPILTYRILNSFGYVVLLIYAYAKQKRWWNTFGAHYGREFALWLDLSCAYWFFSEVRLRARRHDQELVGQEENPDFEETRPRNNDKRDDVDDERDSAWK